MSKWTLVLVLAIGAFALLAVLAFLPLHPVGEAKSPDGAFLAVVKAPIIYRYLSVMPGQSGDRPGAITIYREGRSCGSAPVDMVSMIDDLRWELSRSPREVSLVAAARWDLDACSVEVYPR
jgi:hypothetical protein